MTGTAGPVQIAQIVVSAHQTSLEMVHVTIPANEIPAPFSQAWLAQARVTLIDFPAPGTNIFAFKIIVAVESSKRAFVQEMSQFCLKVVSFRAARGHNAGIVAGFR